MKIFIASDHGGYIVKKEVVNGLIAKGYEVEDLGTDGLDNVDYVDYGIKLGETIADNNNTLGIGICKTGNGFCMICNKVKKIRCVKVDTIADAVQSKEHHSANILAFGAIKGSNFIVDCIDQFINSKFLGDERYLRRIEKIRNYEENNAI